jgi:PD-(D/E)XK nuclease superfamily
MSIESFYSRSKQESFLACPRLGYLRYCWDDRGLARNGASVYLSTGTYTHYGLELILKEAQRLDREKRILPSDEFIEEVIKEVARKYLEEINRRGFNLEDGESSANERYVVMEQIALVEASLRCFVIRILPDLLGRYKILTVETEEVARVGEIVIQGRIDAVLEEIDTSDLYILSFKTSAQWDKRQEKTNQHDKQGLSETWLLENRLNTNGAIESLQRSVMTALEGRLNVPPEINAASEKYFKYLDKFKTPQRKVMGVLMIFMLKGKRYESYSTPGLWEQHTPLIRGYRKAIGMEYEYAPSLYFDNPNNKSGKGRLGKGWEPFRVWEDEQVGFVKGWIEKANRMELGSDIIGESFKIPAPYFRNGEDIHSWHVQATNHEREIAAKLQETIHTRASLDRTFPQNTKHCHYPSDCEMVDICFISEVFNDPIGSRLYIYRTPHHQAEYKEHDSLYQISKYNPEPFRPKKIQEEDIFSGEEIMLEEDEIILEE